VPEALGLVLDGFKHHRVHHHENEFARGKRHINGIESFWGFAKTRLAKQHGVRAYKFPQHLKESEWRWNHRRDNRYTLLLKNTRSHPLNQERPFGYNITKQKQGFLLTGKILTGYLNSSVQYNHFPIFPAASSVTP
jgi:hypothetical protein